MIKDMKSKILSINDLTKYQDDAIVSKMIVNSEKGSITLFAFDKGQGLNEHTAPFDAIVQIIEGEAKITISGEEYTLSSGQMIIMPANKPHAVKSITKFKMMLIMIKS
jgi:quercetin dioxygenase-like cupin family protein